jgi:hypothetical protein
MIPIALGLFIRELVLPFALLALAFAVVEKQWRAVAGWVGVLAVWGAFMAWHASQVNAQALPGDIASKGWHGLQGLSGFLKAVIFTSTLQPLPLGVALLTATLPLLGWLRGREGRFCILLVLGYALMIGLFSRADTFYWGDHAAVVLYRLCAAAPRGAAVVGLLEYAGRRGCAGRRMKAGAIAPALTSSDDKAVAPDPGARAIHLRSRAAGILILPAARRPCSGRSHSAYADKS